MHITLFIWLGFFNEILLVAVGGTGDQHVLKKHLLPKRREGDGEGAIFLSL